MPWTPVDGCWKLFTSSVDDFTENSKNPSNPVSIPPQPLLITVVVIILSETTRQKRKTKATAQEQTVWKFWKRADNYDLWPRAQQTSEKHRMCGLRVYGQRRGQTICENRSFIVRLHVYQEHRGRKRKRKTTHTHTHTLLPNSLTSWPISHRSDYNGANNVCLVGSFPFPAWLCARLRPSGLLSVSNTHGHWMTNCLDVRQQKGCDRSWFIFFLG